MLVLQLLPQRLDFLVLEPQSVFQCQYLTLELLYLRYQLRSGLAILNTTFNLKIIVWSISNSYFFNFFEFWRLELVGMFWLLLTGLPFALPKDENKGSGKGIKGTWVLKHKK